MALAPMPLPLPEAVNLLAVDAWFSALVDAARFGLGYAFHLPFPS